MDNLYKHAYETVNGVTLHLVQAGPEDGPLLIFLHGFPEYWRGWHKQIDFFAAAGFRVWVPDQRGYNLSSKPRSIQDYNLDALAKDVVGLIDTAVTEQAYLVGHDWGGAVAWWTAVAYPERLKKICIMNVAHHSVMRRNVQKEWVQRLKSWYMVYFQLAKLPELTLKAGNFNALARQMRQSSRPGTFSAEELDLYRHAWAQPGALTAMLNWYRALFQTTPHAATTNLVQMPTLIIWGKQDKFMQAKMAQQSIEYCVNGRLIYLDNATHWIMHEEADKVNNYLLDFLLHAAE